jgi:hypothetical protein
VHPRHRRHSPALPVLALGRILNHTGDRHACSKMRATRLAAVFTARDVDPLPRPAATFVRTLRTKLAHVIGCGGGGGEEAVSCGDLFLVSGGAGNRTRGGGSGGRRR